MLSPDELKMVRARKVTDHGTGPFAIPLAQLTESILLNESIGNLTKAVEAIELPEPQDIEIPEYPTEITVSNLPEVQKVEIMNLPKDKDDKEQLKLLRQIAEELKKKEQYAYDIEIDAALKEQLKGEKGDMGVGLPGKNGSPDTPEEIVKKLNTLEEKVELKAIKGAKKLVAEIDNLRNAPRGVGFGVSKIIAGAGVSISPSDGRGDVTLNVTGGISNTFETVSANLSAYDATLNYNGSGDITSIVYSNGVTKTFNYTGADITSIVLSGSTPDGIELTKTLSYTDGNVTGITYS